MIAAIAIPTSIVATFALIWYMGFTLNMLTMLALTLSVGIVIDDAIVVLENIYRFIEEKGMPPMQAAVEATQEIGLAVMATTFSLVAIFAPVGFMSGMVGRFMQSFGLTMAFAVLVSLFVSFTLTPMMSAYWLKPTAEGREHDSKHNRLFEPLDRGYTRMLEWAMAHRGLVAVATVLVLLSSVPLFMITDVNFTPEDDQSQFDISLRAPEGTSLAATDVLANRLGAAVRKIPEVDFTLTTVAGDAAGTLNTATILVRLHPIEERERDQFAVMAEVRDHAAAGLRRRPASARRCRSAAARAAVAAASSSWCRAPTSISSRSTARRCSPRPATIPGLVDVDTTLNAGKPEMSVLLDRPKAADLGVQIGGRGRSAAPARRAAIRSRPTTRPASSTKCTCAREEGQRGIAGSDCRAAGAVVAPRHRHARQHRDLRGERLAGDDQPHGPPAPGDAERQHAAGHVAGDGAGGDCRRRRRAQLRPRVPRRTSPAARASSIARPRRS